MSTTGEAKAFEALALVSAVVAAVLLIRDARTNAAQAAVLVGTALMAALPLVWRIRAPARVRSAQLASAFLVLAGGVATYPIGGLGFSVSAILMFAAGTINMIGSRFETKRMASNGQGTLGERTRKVSTWGVITSVLAFFAAVLIYSWGFYLVLPTLAASVWTLLLWVRLSRPRPISTDCAATAAAIVLCLGLYGILLRPLAPLVQQILR